MSTIWHPKQSNLMAREIGQSIGEMHTTTTIGGDLSESASDSAIAPGSISVTAQVTVRFKLN